MKTYIIKVKNEEFYLKDLKNGKLPFVTEEKEKAGIFEEDKAKEYVLKLNDLHEEYDWEWEKVEVEKMEEEILDIKRENYKLRKENFELIQDNAKLQEEVKILEYKLKEKICFESHTEFKKLNNENNDLKEKLEIQGNLTETYYKIAEKLAKEIYNVSYYASCDSDYISQLIYKWKEPRDNEKEGIRIAIEWAREEVKSEQEKR